MIYTHKNLETKIDSNIFYYFFNYGSLRSYFKYKKLIKRKIDNNGFYISHGINLKWNEI